MECFYFIFTPGLPSSALKEERSFSIRTLFTHFSLVHILRLCPNLYSITRSGVVDGRSHRVMKNGCPNSKRLYSCDQTSSVRSTHTIARPPKCICNPVSKLKRRCSIFTRKKKLKHRFQRKK